MIRRLFRALMYHVYRPLLLRYLAADRTYCYDGFDLVVRQGVFHPAFFGSSKVFARFLKHQRLLNQEVLEIGCGSGLLALTAARAGGRVTACDINHAAVACTRENAQRNGLDVKVVASDLFNNVPRRAFDVVIVNPPFYAGDPTDDASHAWYCGTEFDFFHRFFNDLDRYTHAESRVWMILADTCDMDNIRRVAEQYNRTLLECYRQKKFMETFWVYEVVSRLVG